MLLRPQVERIHLGFELSVQMWENQDRRSHEQLLQGQEKLHGQSM